jgi:hypothetical protein
MPRTIILAYSGMLVPVVTAASFGKITELTLPELEADVSCQI